jgi:hypothetical protein
MRSVKLVVLGGLAYFVVTWILGFATGPLIHNGYLKADYQATSEFWRPELNQDPPDMAALMPRWLTTGLIGSFLVAWIYGQVRGAFAGPGWKRGLRYGFLLALLGGTFGLLGYAGIFNLPDKIWTVWFLESFLYYLVGGAVLGWVAERFAP